MLFWEENASIRQVAAVTISLCGETAEKDLMGVQRLQAHAAACGPSTAVPPQSHCSSTSPPPCNDAAHMTGQILLSTMIQKLIPH